MDVAGGEIAIRSRVTWVVLDCEEEFRYARQSAEEMREAYIRERRADAGAGAEAQSDFGVLDRDVQLACP